jgi:hypothetical protein
MPHVPSGVGSDSFSPEPVGKENLGPGEYFASQKTVSTDYSDFRGFIWHWTEAICEYLSNLWMNSVV